MSDYEIDRIVDLLLKNKKQQGLKKTLKLFDLVKQNSQDEFCNPKQQGILFRVKLEPKIDSDAENLIKQTHDVHYEALSGPSIDTQQQYPIPLVNKRKNTEDEFQSMTESSITEDEDAVNNLTAAQNSNTPPEVLNKLADDEEFFIRGTVAQNLNTPSETLNRLADDENKYVRQVVAKNSNTPPEVLNKLADDGSDSVRRYVAQNPNTPPEALNKLADDGSVDVRMAVVENPNTSSDYKFRFNVDQQTISNIPKQLQKNVLDKVSSFLQQKTNKDIFSWSEVSKFFNFNQQPKEVKDLLSSLNNNGKVSKQDLENLQNTFKQKLYGISYSKYSGVQSMLYISETDIEVIQLNITKELEDELKKDIEFYDFYKKLSDTSYLSGHPVVKNLTVAWMRYYDFKDYENVKDTWWIEEIQTDLLFAIKNEKTLETVFKGDKNKQKEFASKANDFFADWERALLAHLKHLAIQKNVKHIFMASDLVKERTAGLGSGKANVIYKELPKQVGFKKLNKQEVEKLSPTIASNLKDNEYLWYATPQQIKESLVYFNLMNKLFEGFEGKPNMIPKFDIKRHQFPPDPHEQPDEYPYDDMNVAIMNSPLKGRKRSLTAGKNNIQAFMKGLFDTDIDSRQSGGSGMGYDGRPTTKSGDMSMNSRSWNKRGMPGWASSPFGKKFDLPTDDIAKPLPSEKIEKTEEDVSLKDLDKLKKSAPVGSSVPNLSTGGRMPPRRMGFRKR